MKCYFIKARLSCNHRYCEVRFHVKALNEFDAAYHGMMEMRRLAWVSYFEGKENPKIAVHIMSVEDVTEQDMEVSEDEE